MIGWALYQIWLDIHERKNARKLTIAAWGALPIIGKAHIINSFFLLTFCSTMFTVWTLNVRKTAFTDYELHVTCGSCLVDNWYFVCTLKYEALYFLILLFKKWKPSSHYTNKLGNIHYLLRHSWFWGFYASQLINVINHYNIPHWFESLFHFYSER